MSQGEWGSGRRDARADGLVNRRQSVCLQAYKNEFNYPLAQMEDLFEGDGYVSRLVEET